MLATYQILATTLPFPRFRVTDRGRRSYLVDLKRGRRAWSIPGMTAAMLVLEPIFEADLPPE
jgi:hypothetical protein